MLRLSRQLINLAVAFLCATVTTVLAEDISFPTRDGTRPATTQGVPHVQLGVEPVPELVERMLSRVAEFPGVSLGPTRVSLPGTVGFQLDDDVALAKPNAIVSGR